MESASRNRTDEWEQMEEWEARWYAEALLRSLMSARAVAELIRQWEEDPELIRQWKEDCVKLTEEIARWTYKKAARVVVTPPARSREICLSSDQQHQIALDVMIWQVMQWKASRQNEVEGAWAERESDLRRAYRDLQNAYDDLQRFGKFFAAQIPTIPTIPYLVENIPPTTLIEPGNEVSNLALAVLCFRLQLFGVPGITAVHALADTCRGLSWCQETRSASAMARGLERMPSPHRRAAAAYVLGTSGRVNAADLAAAALFQNVPRYKIRKVQPLPEQVIHREHAMRREQQRAAAALTDADFEEWERMTPEERGDVRRLYLEPKRKDLP